MSPDEKALVFDPSFLKKKNALLCLKVINLIHPTFTGTCDEFFNIVFKTKFDLDSSGFKLLRNC